MGKLRSELCCMLLLALTPTLDAQVCVDTDGDGVDDSVDVCCSTPAGTAVNAEGRPFSDVDLDCDSDMHDLAIYMRYGEIDVIDQWLRGVTGPLDPQSACTPPFLVELNQVRADVSAGLISGQPAAEPDLPPLVWDSALAAAAQVWVDQCMLGYDPTRAQVYVEQGGVLDQGNWIGASFYAYSSSAQEAYPIDAVSAWLAEADAYNYDTNSCSGTCGHYTLMVWDNTTRVGCAMVECSVLDGFFSPDAQYFMCYYYPGGNYAGQRPYEVAP